MRIGVLSDTHNHFDPALPRLLAGVGHILHAGDIGRPWILLELEQIAPVTAVGGNNDEGLPYPETARVQLADRSFLIRHIVDPGHPDPEWSRCLLQENPDVVVFGHTHRRFCETIGRRLFLNPGYAGRSRFGEPRSLAILDCAPGGIRAEFRDLG